MMKRALFLVLLAGCGLRPSLPPLKEPLTVEDIQQREEERNSQYLSKPLRKYGYDCMALATYCDLYLHAPKLPYVSTLLNTFGDPIPCLDRAVPIHGLTDVQFDLVDYTCYRNGVCPAGTPPVGDTRTIQDRAKLVEAFHRRHPDLVVWASPALEYDVKDERTLRAMLGAAKEGCPSCQIIQSPYSGLRLPDFKLELHGNTAKAFSRSNDGSSIFDGDSAFYRLSGDAYVAAWFPEFNDRFAGEKSFTPPKLRTCRPTASLFEEGFLVLEEPQPAASFPQSCQIKRDVLNPEILKPNAESYCQGAPRDNKPLFISKISGRPGDRLDVVSAADKPLGFFRYYGPFISPGLSRWYLGTGSGQDPVTLFRQAGGEWAFIKHRTGGKMECIRFNTIRRQGSFR